MEVIAIVGMGVAAVGVVYYDEEHSENNIHIAY